MIAGFSAWSLMSFEIDWDQVSLAINPPKTTSLEFSKVAGQFRKVAFDAYEKIGETGLWELTEREDGVKVLVALYEEEDLQKKASVRSAWTAGPTKAGESVTLQYRGIPVVKFAGKDYGFDPTTADKFSSFIVKEAQDKAFVAKLASTLGANQRAFLLDLISKGE